MFIRNMCSNEQENKTIDGSPKLITGTFTKCFLNSTNHGKDIKNKFPPPLLRGLFKEGTYLKITF